jgi:hypothetical protein
MKFGIWISAFLFGVPAVAADFTALITDIDGAAIEDGTADKKPFTLGDAAVKALVTPYPDEPNLAAEEKFKRAELAFRIRNKPDLVMSAEETAMVKKLIGKAYAPIVVFRAWPMLDPTTAPK